GPVILFFSVNGSGHFCGVAQMTSGVDWAAKSSVFSGGHGGGNQKWEGVFGVRWVFLKDVPNSWFKHLRVRANENKPVTNSRDTQELPTEIGYEMLKIFGDYERTTCILDDWNW
ncbi:YTH domain-containing protein, partial [Chytriomyces sp. MP71]